MVKILGNRSHGIQKNYNLAMKLENLNVKKATLLLAIVSALVFFIIGVQIGNGVLLSLIFSLTFSIPFAWALGLVLALIYEGLKLCRPILDWLFR